MEAVYFIVGSLSFLAGCFVESILTKLGNAQEAKRDKAPHDCSCQKSPIPPSSKGDWCTSPKMIPLHNTCSHPEHAMKIRVVEAYVTCETVEHYCSECGKVICSITDCV